MSLLTSPTATPSPDIEIYLQNTEHSAIVEWLLARFEQHNVSARPAGKKQWRLLLQHHAAEVPVLIIENAHTGFTSLWLNSDSTPWPDDIACAREAHAHFHTEVRATPSSWREGDDPDTWWYINTTGEGLVQWLG